MNTREEALPSNSKKRRREHVGYATFLHKPIRDCYLKFREERLHAKRELEQLEANKRDGCLKFREERLHAKREKERLEAKKAAISPLMLPASIKPLATEQESMLSYTPFSLESDSSYPNSLNSSATEDVSRRESKSTSRTAGIIKHLLPTATPRNDDTPTSTTSASPIGITRPSPIRLIPGHTYLIGQNSIVQAVRRPTPTTMPTTPQAPNPVARAVPAILLQRAVLTEIGYFGMRQRLGYIRLDPRFLTATASELTLPQNPRA